MRRRKHTCLASSSGSTSHSRSPSADAVEMQAVGAVLAAPPPHLTHPSTGAFKHRRYNAETRSQEENMGLQQKHPRRGGRMERSLRTQDSGLRTEDKGQRSAPPKSLTPPQLGAHNFQLAEEPVFNATCIRTLHALCKNSSKELRFFSTCHF